MSDHEKFSPDFTELSQSGARDGYGFQSLIADLGRELGYRVEQGGTGPDRGRDLFFFITCPGPDGKIFDQKWLVTCKDNSKAKKSVGRGDVATAFSDAHSFNCDGLLVACTTQPTDDLTVHLRELETNSKCPIKTHIWSGADIKKMLHDREASLRLFLIRNFPTSYGFVSTPAKQVTEELMELLAGINGDELIERAERLSSKSTDTLFLYKLAELVLTKFGDLEPLFVLLCRWASIENQDFRTGLEAQLELFIDKHYEETLTNRASGYIEQRLSTLSSPTITYMHVFESFIELENDEVLIDCRFETEFEFDDRYEHETRRSYGTGQVIIKAFRDEVEFSSFYISSEAFE